MALGVMLVVAVLLIIGVVDDSFRNNSSLGYDTIVVDGNFDVLEVKPGSGFLRLSHDTG